MLGVEAMMYLRGRRRSQRLRRIFWVLGIGGIGGTTVAMVSGVDSDGTAS